MDTLRLAVVRLYWVDAAMMSDSFWVMVGVVAPVLIVQVFQYLATRKNEAKAVERQEVAQIERKEMKDKVGDLSVKVDDLHQTTQAILTANTVPGALNKE